MCKQFSLRDLRQIESNFCFVRCYLQILLVNENLSRWKSLVRITSLKSLRSADRESTTTYCALDVRASRFIQADYFS